MCLICLLCQWELCSLLPNCPSAYISWFPVDVESRNFLFGLQGPSSHPPDFPASDYSLPKKIPSLRSLLQTDPAHVGLKRQVQSLFLLLLAKFTFMGLMHLSLSFCIRHTLSILAGDNTASLFLQSLITKLGTRYRKSSAFALPTGFRAKLL